MQSKKNSLLEVITNTSAGFAVSYTAGYFIYPLFGYAPAKSELLLLTVAFTFVSIARGFMLRRIFNFFTG